MQSWEKYDQSLHIRQRALTVMDDLRLPSTPINFELWFFYALGHDHDLCRALDAAVQNGNAHDAVRMKEIHTRFFVRSDHRLDQASATINRELVQLQSALSTVGDGATEYRQVLGDTREKLENASAPSVFTTAVLSASSATEEMEARNRVLELQVEASRRELAALRTKMESIRQEGRTDSLTELHNRRAFDERIETAIRDTTIDRQPLCVLMCDIDRFKLFNDKWGHATGDQVLRLVAALTKANIKGKDFAARYGGEELVVILPQTHLSDAIGVADRIRTVIESKKVIKKSTGEPLGQVTISIGVAQYLSGEMSGDLLSRADAHLYAAKHQGRNRVSWIAAPSSLSGLGETSDKSASITGSISTSFRNSTPALELEFVDQDTPLIVDAEVNAKDERLVRLLDWWKAMRVGSGLPTWKDDYLQEVDYARDHLHLHKVLAASDELCVRFVGPSLVRVLGADPTGLTYSASQVPISGLKSVAGRVFELAKLTARMREPLRACSKGIRHLDSGNFNSEVLFLPFADPNGQMDMLLGATIYTPISESEREVAA